MVTEFVDASVGESAGVKPLKVIEIISDKLIVEMNDYNNEYVKHKSEIAEHMKQLEILNINTLQLQLDTDIFNNKPKNYYKTFLENIIHSISRIFFDSKAINTNIININETGIIFCI